MANVDDVKQQYEPRIEALMQTAIADVAARSGYIGGGVFTMHDTEYTWQVLLTHPSKPSVDISFTILEGEQSDGPENTIAFAVALTADGGRPLGGHTPYNYTEDLWVSCDDASTLEERFAQLEQMHPHYYSACVNEA